MPIRLNQIAKEFHITLNEIACFLQEKYGICVTSLNDTITEEQYAEMCAHYRRDKVYHEIVKNKYRKWKKEKELYTEEETDSLNTLIHLLYIEGKINRSERSELEKIRDCRNQNAHGNEKHTKISKILTENYILKTFELINSIVK